MNVLIDTHVLLWMARNDAQLTHDCKRILADMENDVFVSTASIWEIAIKSSLGKLDLKRNFDEFLKLSIIENNIKILEIKLKHLSIVATLPQHHGDPFDRLIISQALYENLPIISFDSKFDLYEIKRIS